MFQVCYVTSEFYAIIAQLVYKAKSQKAVSFSRDYANANFNAKHFI